MRRRRRETIGRSDTPCELCGAAALSVVESRDVRRGLAVLNPGWDAHVRTYEVCPDCGAKWRTEDGTRV